MALILKDRVKETSSSSGTGNITLGGAFPGYQTFNATIASGSTVYYTIHNLTAGVDSEWEVGLGTFTSPATLARTTVLSSSNSGSAVNFTAGASGLEVFITQPAEEAVYLNQATGLVEIGGNGTNTVSFTNINTTNLTANTVTLTAGTISTNASNTTDIVNKQYVDDIVAAGVHYHEPVLVESPTALNAVYVQPNGAGNGVGATLTNNGSNVALVIDGVTLSNTARVLVYTQANAVQNGVYTVTNPGNVSAQWVLTRATDADTYVVASSAGLSEGSTFFVESGDTGAGEVYTCNTQGTITFGTTDITFAQIGSAQIYSAGTGLSLTNTTFSIANTAVTAAQYGNDGAVGQFTVNAQGQLTNAANVSINASSISVGTLANDRTTAASANGASTIVLRDSNGAFAGGVITAANVSSTILSVTGTVTFATTASNINIGTSQVAPTLTLGGTAQTGTMTLGRSTVSQTTNIQAGATASGSTKTINLGTNGVSGSTTVINIGDANGTTVTVSGTTNLANVNVSGNVSAGGSISGNGATLSAINASNISSGTIANARTTASEANGASTIVSRDSSGSFTANVGTFTSVSGNGIGLTAINASNIASGTIANARTTAATANGASTIVLRGASGEFAAGAITGTSFSGNGSAITAINATAITTGTLDNARTNATSANGASTLVVRDANGSFAGNVITGTTGTFTNISGNATSLTAINASNISSGTIANARTTGATANGASTIVLRGTSGEFSAGIITADGSGLSAINASNISSGTVASARISGSYTGITGVGTLAAGTWNANVIGNVYTTANSANGASTIVARDANGSFTANVGTFTTVSGAGGGLTSINASNISSGTIANARTTAATANGASTIVLRGTSGEFTAGAITGVSFTGSGAALSAINASNLSSGTVATARISGSYTGITGVGTISAGTWQGTSISTTYTDAKVTSATAVAGTGISVSSITTTGAATHTITNTGVTSLTGTANQITVSASTGSVTLSTPQAIATGSSVQFGSFGVGTAASGTTGEIRATNNVTAFYSDERLKTKTGNIENALDKVCQIETMLYHANEVAVALGYDASIPEVGVTAQSVQKVQPEIVVPAPIDDKYLTVRYEKLIPLLIEAIKELKAEVDALKGK